MGPLNVSFRKIHMSPMNFTDNLDLMDLMDFFGEFKSIQNPCIMDLMDFKHDKLNRTNILR